MDTKAESLSQQLDKIATALSPEDLPATLSTLRRIFDNIIQHPNNNNYRQIKLASKTFNSKVWRYRACEELMKMSGWVVEDDHVRLRDDSQISIMSHLLNRRNIQANSQFSAKEHKREYPVNLSEKHNTEKFVPTNDVCVDIGSAIYCGRGERLKQILKQFSTSEVRCMWLFGSTPVIFTAFRTRQIGIVRILVRDYGVDINGLDSDGRPCFLELFSGCDSSDASQSLIIEFIKEFKLQVCMVGKPLSAIHLACFLKLHIVLKHLIEKCRVDVNQLIGDHDIYVNGGTALHIAYGIGDKEIVQYLTEHGADLDIIDSDGKKPQEYMMIRNTVNFYSVSSDYLIKRCKIYGDFASEELCHFWTLCERGVPQYEAVNLTLKEFPEFCLNKEVITSLETTPTMNKLNHYVTDMAPSYYTIGLELGIPYNKLKVIKSDPSLVDLQEKCRKMLEVWLEIDTSASWRRLCDAIEDDEVGLRALAQRMKEQLV